VNVLVWSPFPGDYFEPEELTPLRSKVKCQTIWSESGQFKNKLG